MCVHERERGEGRKERGRERISLCTVESADKEKPQYKSLLDLPYTSRELTEKLDETQYSNPTRPKSHTQRAIIIISSAPGKQLHKRRPSMPISNGDHP